MATVGLIDTFSAEKKRVHHEPELGRPVVLPPDGVDDFLAR